MDTVLMVDDNASLACFTARLLQRGIDGLDVVTAFSASEARNIVQRCKPSVVISDVKLPDGSGIDLVKELSGVNPEIAAILISGEAPTAAALNDLFGFLLKPYEADALVDLVRRALERAQRSVAPARPMEVGACKGYDRHHLQNRLGGLLVGLRAMGADLRAQSQDPLKVNGILDEYLDRLCEAVLDVSQGLPVCPSPSRAGAREG